MADQEKTEFREMAEVAVRMNQPSGEISSAPDHEAFTKDGNVRLEQCPACDAIYSIGFSRIYLTRRSFEDLSIQLQLRLEEDHVAKREHRPLIPLRWSDTTSKRAREEES
jgi:hypothetical protein